MRPSASAATVPVVASSLRGTPVVPGVAFGPVVLVPPEPDPADLGVLVDHQRAPAEALELYDRAAAAVAARYAERAARAAGPATEVLEATAGLARDPGLRAAVATALESGSSVVSALDVGVGGFVELFVSMGGLMAERVSDLHDLRRRLTAELAGLPEPGIPEILVPSILVADDLSPADTAGLDPSRVLALVTQRGGATSHTAIIARQLGLPCVVGVAGATDLAGGAAVLVDGDAGTVETDVSDDMAADRVARDQRERAAAATWSGPATTSDGRAVTLLANVADGAGARAAAQAPVSGVGLFRTELCFLGRSQEPTVAEQATAYAAVLEAFGPGRRVVVRTLDAGSDKPLAYATLPDEQNPALGVRGIRLAAHRDGLLSRQLEAIAHAARSTSVRPWVMAPMISTVAEAADFAERVRGHDLSPGVMVEVPSAALLADRLLAEVDFLSIGTNDLTQYAMAADRMAAELAELTDAWQPAVLWLIAMTAEAGRRLGKPVGVCGEAAADPLLAPVLIGMGITSLSMAPSAVRSVGARLAEISLDVCERAADAALAAADPSAARAAVREVLSRH